MTKLLQSLLLGAALATNVAAKPSVTLTNLCNETPIQRVEAFTKLSKNVDHYTVLQKTGNVNFYKTRLQWTPINSGKYSFGLASQAKDTNITNSETSLGLVGRIQSKLPGKGFGKMDVRYFPKTNTIEGYGFINNKDTFVDMLSGYNTKTGKGFHNPGIDFKMNKNKSFRIEANLDQNFKKRALRVGVRYRF
ncbi:MAG: hypothetical protein U9R08_00275 [Nanoarchaeota archaeon]|nr:hypothetical protein [Nanoarchaeota archaeon]